MTLRDEVSDSLHLHFDPAAFSLYFDAPENFIFQRTAF
jgi:hypothetical protein